MLPYTATVLFSNLAQYNTALWPLPVVALVLALAVVVLAVRPVPFSDRAIAGLLALAWLWIGYGYHYLQFATINFAAPIYAVFFMVEGLLLAWAGLVRARAGFRFRSEPAHWVGLLLALGATIGVPLADALSGYGWESARVVGLAPGPTALFTLGLMLMSEQRAPVHLAVIPLLWLLIAGASGWALRIPQDLVLAVAGLAGFLVLLLEHRRSRS